MAKSKTTIYVAISKETGEVLPGIRNQAAFTSESALKKSMRFKFEYMEEDPSYYYDIKEIDINLIL